MVRGKKKYQSGEGARYISRTQALKYLQLSLNDFRRLCILKGVYPREPRNRKKAQKGDIGIKTLYHKKDIQFLLHEPIIEKFRELRVLFKKIRRARSIREFSDVQRFRDAFPVVKLDNIVKERYPTFIDALRDLDDCLTLMFLFATFPALRHAPLKITTLCRRLTIEFLHYVMAARALRKVFISIKGYYYQAEIKGQTVTWIVPHHFSYEPQSKHEVDFRVMTTFVEFYTVLLGFVNFRLYHSLNLVYPPTFTEYSTCGTDPSLIEEGSYVQERIATLNVSLGRKGESVEDDATELDEFPLVEDQTKLDELRKEAEQNKKLKTLFKGLKFYVNREVPREPVVFIIRCFGGEVSWDKNTFLGATFDESDETITHQIVDRTDMKQQYISRYYVQPQWLFDSVNARELLPIEKYFAGVILPPHLSPFHDEHKLDQYIPPEEMALRDPSLVQKEDETSESDEDEDEEEDEEEDDEDDDIEESSPKLKRRKTEIDHSSEEDEEEEEEEEDDDDDDDDEDEDEDKDEDEEENEKKVEIEKERLQKRKTMAVTAGTVTRENPLAKKEQERQEFKLREKMVRNKYRKLYKSMVQGKRQRAKEAWLLGKKRSLIDAEEKAKRKAEKKNEKVSKAQTQKTVSA